MTARSYLYRRNGIYYFRWPIPLAYRQRMPPGSPAELRASLHTPHPATARHLAARHWLAALDVSHHFLVSDASVSYNDLLTAIRRHPAMDGNSSPGAPTGDSLQSVGEVAGSTELQKLKDTIAALDRAGATFYVTVVGQPVEVWGRKYDEEGTQYPQIIEVLRDFADDRASLSREGIRNALAADKNLFTIAQVHSDQPGLQNGYRQDRYLEVVLTTPLTLNLNELKVAKNYALQVAAIAPPAKAQSAVAADCEAIRLSEAKNSWLKQNRMENGGSWKKATSSNYDSYVQQFITIVGDKQTTELQARDFDEYERLMRTLPANWFITHKKTGKSPAQIALEHSNTRTLSAKTLKDKGSVVSLFFTYLKSRGYWHGRYGGALFDTVRISSKQKARHVFSDDELKILFSGIGVEVFRQAQFPLYVWGSVLLLFTGARPAEISQLQFQDVLQDDEGTWYLRLMQDDEGNEGASAYDDKVDAQKQFKTESSERSIPLHPRVLQLGFLDYTKRFKAGERLFPEAFRHNQKASREIGDWFNGKLLKETGLKRQGVVLYSLRHTVINRFKANAKVDHYACAYTGHSTADDKTISNRVYREKYGRAFSPTTLAQNLHSLLDFPIDWTPLTEIIKQKKWS